MVVVHPQYVVDENNSRKAVVLGVEEWNLVLKELEELDDIRAFDKAKAEPQESIAFDQAVREIHEDLGT